MSPTQISDEQTTRVPTAEAVDTKLEVVVIPVSDVDRAKRFYGGLGWRLDADFPSITVSGSSSSSRPDPPARSSLARTSPRLRLAQPKISI